MPTKNATNYKHCEKWDDLLQQAISRQKLSYTEAYEWDIRNARRLLSVLGIQVIEMKIEIDVLGWRVHYTTKEDLSTD